jgi:hypothetical protein
VSGSAETAVLSGEWLNGVVAAAQAAETLDSSIGVDDIIDVAIAAKVRKEAGL